MEGRRQVLALDSAQPLENLLHQKKCHGPNMAINEIVSNKMYLLLNIKTFLNPRSRKLFYSACTQSSID